ncbi:MAG: SDR family oxidoreductase [Amaricoccus sp.]|uniref:SDR family NAD(P)-dependent oxidoreductase n=1 Tax=Amaricoccus sp. TaxID=1872485 RepID=UPI0039E4AD8D
MVIVDVNVERGEAIAAELGGEFHALDVSDAVAVGALVADVTARLGVPAAVVNSGGLLRNATRITTMPIEEFDRIQAVNVRGTPLVGREFATRMAEAGGGAIINLCSMTTFQPWPQPGYAVSKTSVKMLTEIMAAELGPQGVRVNAVAPGFTLTSAMKGRIERGERDPSLILARSALGRMVEPSEVAEAIFFLCSPAAGAITGVTLPVDAGWLVRSTYLTAAAQPA